MKCFYLTICTFLFVTGFMSCKKDSGISLSPLQGTWDQVGETGFRGSFIYPAGSSASLTLNADYTYSSHTTGIPDRTGSFKLIKLNRPNLPSVNAIQWNDNSTCTYAFIKDTLLLVANPGPAEDMAIWETKYVRTAK